MEKYNTTIKSNTIHFHDTIGNRVDKNIIEFKKYRTVRSITNCTVCIVEKLTTITKDSFSVNSKK